MQTSDNDILVKVSRSFILGAVVLGAPTFFMIGGYHQGFGQGRENETVLSIGGRRDGAR